MALNTKFLTLPPTADFPVSMFINFTIDPQIWFTAGNFHINYDIFQNGARIFRHPESGRIQDLPHRPATNFWVDWSVYRATDITNGDRIGVFSFRPSIYFDMWGPGGSYIPDEFAVAEEDYVFGIE
jgi:hypothetical protein